MGKDDLPRKNLSEADGEVTSNQNGQEFVKYCFKIAYYTIWGQNLKITGDGPLLGNWDKEKACAMSCRHEGRSPLQLQYTNQLADP